MQVALCYLTFRDKSEILVHNGYTSMNLRSCSLDFMSWTGRAEFLKYEFVWDQ